MSGIDGRRWGAATAGCLIVAAVMAGLHLLGSGPLAAPGVGSLAELQTWMEDRDAVTVGVVALRLVALGVGYHLIATTALALVGRLLRCPWLVRFAEASTLPPLRGVVRRLAGLGLSAAAVLATPLPPVAADPAGTATVAIAPAPVRPGPAVLERIESGGPKVLERIEPSAAEPTGTATLRVVASPGPTGAAARATLRVLPDHGPTKPVTVTLERHLVHPGDHLWSIAESRLGAHLGRAPTDREVAPYWRALVAANPRLVDPDLLFPGDEVTVPPPPDAGRASMHRRS